jgi:predicted MPP superfamily phosphohydrolase
MPVTAVEPPALLTRRAALGALGALSVAGLGGAVGLRGANSLHVEPSGPPGGPVHGGSPIRVALVTDLHAPHSWVPAEELADAVRRFDPHLLFVGGDSIDRKGEEAQVRLLEALPARHAKFASLGNHERWCGCEISRLRREYERADVRLLVNEAATVELDGRAVQVVGLDDWRAGRPDYALVRDDSRGWRDAGHRFVVGHCPAAFDDLRRATALPFDVVAGHTHGGQIAPLGVPIFLPYGSGSYVKGWYGGGERRQRLYVSRGVGNIGVPLRLGSPPELALLTF